MIKKYFGNQAQRYASRWLVLFIDIMIVVVTFFMSYLIRFNFTLNFDIGKFLIQLPVLALTAVVSFLIIGSYKGVIRHTGFTDVVNLFKAISLLSFLSIGLVVINKEMNLISGFTIPLSIVVIHSFISFVALSASRLLFKVAFKHISIRFKGCKNIIIYGAGDSGIVTYNALINNPQNHVSVICYMDEDPKKHGKFINGVPILNPSKINDTYIKHHNIEEIIVSIQNISSQKLRKLVDSMVELPTNVKIVPPIEKWINGELSLNQIKQVQIEDLLDRIPIEIENPKLQKELQGETIMVTGAAGSIGSEIATQIANYKIKQLVLVDQAESDLYDLQQDLKQKGYTNFTPIVADIRDKNRVDYIYQEFQPTMVFHAAAYKHVPLMECNPYEAIKINVNGTKILADAAAKYKVKKFVFVSTDKAVNPTSVMGATKRIAEMYISCIQRECDTKFITTRFGNVLGSNGSVIPLFKKQIEKGGPLTVTHKDVTRFFMTIPEASQLVLEAGAMGKGGEIFIFDMGESVKIYYLALNMIKLSGLRFPEDINIKITGLRPGEKLYEELLANGENTMKTYHEKIRISKTRALDYTKMKSEIEELCISNRFQNLNIVKKMKSLVPEYKSNNSEFEVLDGDKDSKLQDYREKKLESI
ncbi:polysaccharide biosynthesis protein [Ascidiimonas sp. W6]|uniref:polysaccharide biosynthesis protein n=1 Tax=Ascidiimonas meishanensis TaxID=3128903 RepID=UPI0030EE0AFB